MARRLLALLLAVLAISATRRRSVDPVSFPQIDAIARNALASGIPALSIAVMRGDTVVLTGGYGLMNIETREPAFHDSVYQIGSITKQFTAAAIMKLVEQGKLQTSDRLRTYVPELDARFDAVTIEHLLTHTSGIFEYNNLLVTAWQPKSEAEMLSLIGRRNLLFAPGSNWSYSNSNYYLLGVIIERVSSTSYAQFLDENFFFPLGLTRTSYCREPVPAGYFTDATSTAPVRPADMSLLFAAGAICSTTEDLVRWNRALVQGLAVAPSSYVRMTTPYRLSNGETVEYGYALILDSLDGHSRAWHGGIVLGFEANLAWYPDRDLAVAVLVNVLDLRYDFASEIADAVARELLK